MVSSSFCGANVAYGRHFSTDYVFLSLASQNLGGASREKINLGLAFYGRSFASATGMNEPHDGADNAHWAVDEGTPQYCKPFFRLAWICLLKRFKIHHFVLIFLPQIILLPNFHQWW